LADLDWKLIAAVFFGAANIYFNAANRWFPPQRRASEMSTAASGETVSDRAPSRMRGFLYSAASVGSLLLALYFAYQWGAVPGPPGAKGDRGDTGATGAQGPAGQMDPQIAQVVAALARYDWLSKEKRLFDSQFAEWKSQNQSDLDQMKDAGDGRPGPAFVRRINPEWALVKTISDALDVKVDLSKHPNFDLNPYISAPDADKIKDDFNREEYRRKWDQFNTSMNTLSQIGNTFDNEINTTENIMMNYAKKK
jgi:hypothetical protein